MQTVELVWPLQRLNEETLYRKNLEWRPSGRRIKGRPRNSGIGSDNWNEREGN